MSTKKSHRERLEKIRAAIENGIEGACTFLHGQTVVVKMPDGSLAHARDFTMQGSTERHLVNLHVNGQVVETVAEIDERGNAKVQIPADVQGDVMLTYTHALEAPLNDYAAPVEEDPQPKLKSRHARGRKWWNVHPWQRGR